MLFYYKAINAYDRIVLSVDDFTLVEWLFNLKY